MLAVIVLSFLAGLIVAPISLAVGVPGRGIDFVYATIILMIIMKGLGAVSVTVAELMELSRLQKLIGIPAFAGTIVSGTIAVLAVFSEPMTWFENALDALSAGVLSGIFLGLDYYMVHILDQKPFIRKRLWRIVAGATALSVLMAGILTALCGLIAPNIPLEAIWITLPATLILIAVLFSIGLEWAERITFNA